jgi:hypothetical protein
MPSDLVLLCAADYTQQGATILLPNDGFVLVLSSSEQEYLRSYAQNKPILKKLNVRNNTYEVDAPSSSTSLKQQHAYASTATRYFNSKINVSTVEERILATLLSGLTFKDLLTMTANASILGMPRDITPQSLHRFENKYGRTPDILQLAFPDLSGNKKGYFAPKVPLTRCGERLEADFFVPEFNDIPYSDIPDPTPNPSLKPKKPKLFIISCGIAILTIGLEKYTINRILMVRESRQGFFRCKVPNLGSFISTGTGEKLTIW